jgi:hypothetical protein
MILVSFTYDEITPESAEESDFSDSGFISEREELTFRELVDKFREFSQPSSSGPVDSHVWFSSGWHTTDFRTGTEREESMHFHRDNPPHFEKYWIKAADYAFRKERERRARILQSYEGSRQKLRTR